MSSDSDSLLPSVVRWSDATGLGVALALVIRVVIAVTAMTNAQASAGLRSSTQNGPQVKRRPIGSLRPDRPSGSGPRSAAA